MFIFLVLLTSVMHLIATNTLFHQFYKNKTIDEVWYLVDELERYISKVSPTFRPQLEPLCNMNKNQLASYTSTIIALNVPNLHSIQQFNLKIKIFPSAKTIDDILSLGHRQFLLKWAINAEKYHRIKTRTIHHIGRLIDYANYLPNEQLISYIKTTLSNYPELNDKDLFYKEILNIHEQEASVFEYIQKATRETALYWINNLEKHLKGNKQVLSFDHEKSFNDDLSRESILKALYSSLQENPQLLDVDYFINSIDYNGFKYFYDSLTNLTEANIREFANACEKYNKKQYGLKSFKGLNDYLKEIPIDVLRNYSIQMIAKYPELNNIKLIFNIEENYKLKIYGELSKVLKGLRRKDLIRYYLNLQDTNDFKIKNNEHLNKVFRMQTEDMRNAIIEITRQNRTLQVLSNVREYVDLYSESIRHWLSDMPHIVLADLAFNITQYFTSDQIKVVYSFYDNKNDSELRSYILKLANTYSVKTTKDFEAKILKGIPLYEGLYSYLRSVNRETLAIWVNCFDIKHKDKHQFERVVSSKQRYDQQDKKYYIGKLIYYLKIYPDLNNPWAFDIFVGMNGAHEHIHNKSHDQVTKDASALEAHHRRVSPNIKQVRNISLYYKHPMNTTVNIAYYFIYKMMMVYPELNNIKTYHYITSLPNYDNSSELIHDMFLIQLKDAAYMIQLYTNYTSAIQDETDLSQLDENNLRLYIKQKIEENPELKTDLGRLLNDQSDYLFKNLYSFFHRQSRETLAEFAKRLYNYDKTGKEPDYDSSFSNYLLNYCKSKVDTLPQLMNQTLFDEIVNYVEPNKFFSRELIALLENESRHRLMQMALVISNQHCKSSSFTRYENIALYINSATKPELIRYISTGYNNIEPQLSHDEFSIMIRRQNLGYGEQYIFDLSDQ